MKIHILSDLHLEFADYEPAPVEADVVILAGDIGSGCTGLSWALRHYGKTPVLYVPGNHEFYGHTPPGLIRQLKDYEDTSLHVLDNEFIELNGVTFFGSTLWTDLLYYGNAGQASVDLKIGMFDYKDISMLPDMRKLEPEDTALMHEKALEELTTKLEFVNTERFVMITHHAPLAQSVPARFANSPLNPGFVSKLDNLVYDIAADLWVHGHIHQACDYRYKFTRVLNNPRGYPREENKIGFRPNLVVEI
jgi:Icc-related predicted phosphoesterase